MEKIKLFEVGDEQIHLSPLKPIYANQSLRGGYYYSAADIDSMLTDVRALVETAKEVRISVDEETFTLSNRFFKAIAAVERLTGAENKEPPPKPQPKT